MDVSNLKEQLRARGYKMTRPRQAILEALARETGWLTARALFDELAGQQPNIDFSTVCRNLDTLTDLGVLCRVDRDNNGVFAYSLREIEEHHHHLICRRCGKITPIGFCPLEQLNTGHTKGFSELECRFEVYGTCEECTKLK